MDIGTMWAEGCKQWIEEHRDSGWNAYYLNIMFNALRGTPDGILDQMKDAIHKEFYAPFMTRFVRDPHRKAEQERMPRLLLFPDLPVPKREKHSFRDITVNAGGLHFQGPMLLPPRSRFRECPIEHIDQHQRLYARRNIARIHIVPLDNRLERFASYTVKTIAKADLCKSVAADESHILLLPKPISEVRHGNCVLHPGQKAIKDIQSSLNVSDELARTIVGESPNQPSIRSTMHTTAAGRLIKRIRRTDFSARLIP